MACATFIYKILLKHKSFDYVKCYIYKYTFDLFLTFTSQKQFPEILFSNQIDVDFF